MLIFISASCSCLLEEICLSGVTLLWQLKEIWFFERITLDRDWVSTNVQQLESFYDSFILPRLVLELFCVYRFPD